MRGVLLTMAAVTCAHAQWVIQQSHTTAGLRGIHNAGGGVVWTSGTEGTTAMLGQRALIRPHARGGGVLTGQVTNREGLLLRGLQVYLTGSDGSQYQTSTTLTGLYQFANLGGGDYTLVAGDQRRNVTIREDCSPVRPERVDITDVRWVLDLRSAAVWEVAQVLGIPNEAVRKIGSQLDEITQDDHVASAVGADAALVDRWRRNVVFSWPGLPAESAEAE